MTTPTQLDEQLPPGTPTRGSDVGLRTAFRFVFVSVLAALLNFLSRILFSVFVPFPVAITLAYFVGLATAFFLNRKFVFRGSTNTVGNQAFWFFVVNIVALAQTLLVSLLLADLALPALGVREHAEIIAHAIGIAAPIFTSYFGHKHLSFRNANAA